jgi:D-serine deaminase-like pyridoxal phosphate-dependent protein
MNMIPPASAGMPLAEVDTPALVLDLDAFERNLGRMSDLVAKAGVRLRPHAKTHKSPVIARRQTALGAVGICCQKVSEAEIMVAGGIDDVLVSNQVVGKTKLLRLAALARQAKVGVCVDDADNILELGRAAARFGATIEVLVEIDVGMRRCGVPPGRAAVELARLAADQQHLEFGGLQAYHGSAQHIVDPDERRAAVDRAITMTAETIALMGEAGLACRTIGGAGTGTFPIEAASGVFNELQAGSYIFLDAAYARNEGAFGASSFEHALFVHATVMSRPAEDRAVLDAGLKSFSVDSGLPVAVDAPGTTYTGASDEHGVISLAPGCQDLPLGSKLLLIPGHCDPTVNLHDWYVCVRGMGTEDAHVEALWPVAARGAAF